MEIATSWVPPNVIGDLDHLAVQAPFISLHGRMLPGITNVTVEPVTSVFIDLVKEQS